VLPDPNRGDKIGFRRGDNPPRMPPLGDGEVETALAGDSPGLLAGPATGTPGTVLPVPPKRGLRIGESPPSKPPLEDVTLCGATPFSSPEGETGLTTAGIAGLVPPPIIEPRRPLAGRETGWACGSIEAAAVGESGAAATVGTIAGWAD